MIWNKISSKLPKSRKKVIVRTVFGNYYIVDFITREDASKVLYEDNIPIPEDLSHAFISQEVENAYFNCDTVTHWAYIDPPKDLDS